MAFKCNIGLHTWNGCICSKCGKTRDLIHSWDGCICSICGKTKHDWDGYKCTQCGEMRSELAFTDKRDGQSYKYVIIGNQTWMAENLRYKAKGSFWAYQGNERNIEEYGYLYDWLTATKVCPLGWHLPTEHEWDTLRVFLGGFNRIGAGGKLKEIGTTHWLSPNEGATNESGFNALPGGYLNIHHFNKFIALGVRGYWWSATEYSEKEARAAFLNYDHSNLYIYGNEYKSNGLSVRCIKD